MVSNALAATAILRRHFRRLGSMGLLGLVAAVGLVPLTLYGPRNEGSKYVLLALVCLYAGRKIVQTVHARAALKQLSMEAHFLRYGSSGHRVQKCVENDEHMWTNSRIVDALRTICTHRLPSNLLVDEKRDRIYRRFRTAFREMLPRVAVVDTGLVASIVAGLALSETIAVDLRAVLFQAGFLALGIAVAVEAWRWVVHRQLAEGLDRWFDALSEWTVREGLENLYLHSRAYSHRLLYFAQPWFADGSEVETDTGESMYVVSGDGDVLPANIAQEPEVD